MFLFTYSAVILSLICVGIAALVLTKKKYDRLSLYFIGYILSVSGWIGSNALADWAQSDFTVRLWSGTSLISGCCFISFYLCFIEYFLTEKKLNLKKYFYFFLPTLLFSAIAFTDWYVVETILFCCQPAQIIPGIMNYPILLFQFGGMFYGIGILLQAYPTAKRQKQHQIFYIGSGFFVLLLAAIIFTVILPLYGELRFFTLGPQFALFTILGAAYAIYKHRLLDIRLVLQLGLIYTVLFSGITIIYIFVVFLLLRIMGNGQYYHFFSALITTIIGITTLPYFEKKFRCATDSFFFKEKYYFSDAIHTLSSVLAQHDKLADIIPAAIAALASILRAQNVTFILVREYTNSLTRSTDGVATITSTSSPTDFFGY
jgi:hypothetical protein